MSLMKVAAIAGVSASTVSRVMNDQDGVAPRRPTRFAGPCGRFLSSPPHGTVPAKHPTAKTNRQRRSDFWSSAPAASRRPRRSRTSCAESRSRRGNIISICSSAFFPVPMNCRSAILDQRVGGLLIHGEQPGKEVEAKLRGFPTVWLMANRFPPRWGDQVMPDNSSIGRLAAEYLHERGCKLVSYLSTRRRRRGDCRFGSWRFANTWGTWAGK